MLDPLLNPTTTTTTTNTTTNTVPTASAPTRTTTGGGGIMAGFFTGKKPSSSSSSTNQQTPVQVQVPYTEFMTSLYISNIPINQAEILSLTLLLSREHTTTHSIISSIKSGISSSGIHKGHNYEEKYVNISLLNKIKKGEFISAKLS